MTLISTKESLKKRLGTEKTLLIFFGGDADSVAVHKVAKQMSTDGKLAKSHVPLRVKDLGLLTPTQKSSWAAAEGKYAVSRPGANANRQVISKGSVSKFLSATGKPGKLKILLAFRGNL